MFCLRSHSSFIKCNRLYRDATTRWIVSWLFLCLRSHSTFILRNRLYRDATTRYTHLAVPHEPLRLVTPQFETPLPPLEPAVFPPVFREPPGPALDLFDLDDAFSSERVRLAQLTNKVRGIDVCMWRGMVVVLVMVVNEKVQEEEEEEEEDGEEVDDDEGTYCRFLS